MTAFAERLETYAQGLENAGYGPGATRIAADIRTVLARLARAEGALEPFAKAADVKLCGEWNDDECFGQTDVGFYLSFGDLRRARAALEHKE
jgi:hypothetical protein